VGIQNLVRLASGRLLPFSVTLHADAGAGGGESSRRRATHRQQLAAGPRGVITSGPCDVISDLSKVISNRGWLGFAPLGHRDVLRTDWQILGSVAPALETVGILAGVTRQLLTARR
jgi:hypothetical protein